MISHFIGQIARSMKKQPTGLPSSNRWWWCRHSTTTPGGTKEPGTTGLGGSKHAHNWLPRDEADDSANILQTPRVLRKVEKLMREAAYARKPEVPGAVITKLRKQYLALSVHGKQRALLCLGYDFGPDIPRLQRLTRHAADLLPCSEERRRRGSGGGEENEDEDEDEGPWQREGSEEGRLSTQLRALRDLHVALLPLSARLFEHINAQPGGLKFLVDLRADLLRLLRERNGAGLRALDATLKGMLKAWLGPACLQLRRVTWDDSASLLEKLVSYEAVHPMASILDLKPRLGPGRRCFAYFHPAMPGEPLIFIEVALTTRLISSIQEVLKSESTMDENSATTAMFYSISSTQVGLAGIDLGHALICNVVRELRSSLPNIQEFATLSPIPGFLPWLRSKLALSEHAAPTFSEAQLLLSPEAQTLLHNLIAPPERSVPGGSQMEEALRAADDDDGDGHGQVESAALRGPLLRLCARYLVQERKRGRALDPVANFHIRNGASVERLNWMADKSPRAIQQSAGIMVNYKYRLDAMDDNSRNYIGKGHISASDAITALLLPTRPLDNALPALD